MRALLAFAVVCLTALAAGAAPQPAGNLISYSLAGEDATRGTAVSRKGEPLPPQIYMPLYEDDVIFLDDPASEVVIDIVNEPRKVIKGPAARFKVVGKLPMSDDTWAIYDSIIAIFGVGKTGGAPDTDLVSKGFGISLPSAATGGETNFLSAEGAPVPLIWAGGKSPYTVFIDAGGQKEKLGTTGDQMFRFAAPGSGSFMVMIEDAEISIARLRFQVEPALPVTPEGLLAAAPSEAVAATLLSGWLARLDGSVWRIEAMRRLDALAEKDDAAKRLLDVMAQGWPQ